MSLSDCALPLFRNSRDFSFDASEVERFFGPRRYLLVRRKASPGSFGISAARGMLVSIGAALADFDVAVPVFVRAESGHVIGFAAPGVNGSVSVQYEMHSQLREPLHLDSIVNDFHNRIRFAGTVESLYISCRLVWSVTSPYGPMWRWESANRSVQSAQAAAVRR